VKKSRSQKATSKAIAVAGTATDGGWVTLDDLGDINITEAELDIIDGFFKREIDAILSSPTAAILEE
jgi:hypothetical protein